MNDGIQPFRSERQAGRWHRVILKFMTRHGLATAASVWLAILTLLAALPTQASEAPLPKSQVALSPSGEFLLRVDSRQLDWDTWTTAIARLYRVDGANFRLIKEFIPDKNLIYPLRFYVSDRGNSLFVLRRSDPDLSDDAMWRFDSEGNLLQVWTLRQLLYAQDDFESGIAGCRYSCKIDEIDHYGPVMITDVDGNILEVDIDTGQTTERRKPLMTMTEPEKSLWSLIHEQKMFIFAAFLLVHFGFVCGIRWALWQKSKT